MTRTILFYIIGSLALLLWAVVIRRFLEQWRDDPYRSPTALLRAMERANEDS